jgi:hypothetical protein
VDGRSAASSTAFWLRLGVQLKSKATVSERRVRVTLDDGQTAEHTVFWLVKTTPAGVLDPDDADADGIIGVCSGYV